MLVGLAVCAPWTNIPRDQADSAGMLAHLHAYFVDGDLLYDDEFRRLNLSPLFAFVTDQGVVSNHWPAGATWLQLPGYALGVTAARVLEALGVGKASALGVAAVLGLRAWAGLVLGMMLWAIARLTMRAGGSARLGALVAGAYALGTPLLYYALESPLRPHLWGAACVLGLVVVWHDRTIAADRPVARTLLLALLVGLATAIRPQLAPLVMLPIHDAWTDEDARARALRPRRIAVALAGSAVWPLLHLRTQLWIYGGGVSDYAGEVTVHLRHFLLSPHHGALIWCPVLGIAALAVGRAAWLRQRGAVLIAILLVHQVWLDAGMRAIEVESVLGTRTWAGGTSFAPRKLLDVVPLTLPAVVGLVRDGRSTRWGTPLVVATVIACVPTTLLHAAAYVAPEATTGSLIGSMSALTEVMVLPLSGPRWSSALQARALPGLVPLVITAVVTIPLMVVGWRIAVGLRPASASARLDLGLAALIGGAFVAHAWLSVMQVRSDAAMLDEPERMTRAAAQLDPRHRATVALIPQHHQRLRAVLGEGAAP